MTTRDPNFLTLLAWSHQLAAGQPCADWEEWLAASPRAARQWELLSLAKERLARGQAPLAATELGAADVADYLDGQLPPVAAREFDEACWSSPTQLCEVVSAAQFGRESTEPAGVSSDLTQRLLAIGPKAAERRRRRALRLAEVQLAAESSTPPQVASDAVIARPRRHVARREVDVLRHWPLTAAAAVLVVAAVCGAIGWVMSGPSGTKDRAGVVHEPVPQVPASSNDDGPIVNRIVTPFPPTPLSPPQAVDQPPPVPAAQIATDDPPRATVPQHAMSIPAPTLRQDVAIHSAIGALLVDPGNRGPLRVGKGSYSLAEPLRLVSLAESWSSVEVPDLGTLICDGPAEATIANWGDGVLEVQLVHGKLAFQRLPAGKQIRFQTGGAQWLARGVGNYSTLAVLHDPESPSLFVPTGAVAIEDVNVAAEQIVRFQAGAVQPPQPLAIGVAASISDPLAGHWLTPPDEARRKKWQAQHGKLLEKLAIIDDVGVELPALFAVSKDARQAALLGQWNLAVADEPTRVKQTWAMLGDRRELVRTAGVRCLIELPAGDPRLSNSIRYLRIQLGDDLGNRVAQWLKAAHQPGQIPANQAVELAEFLGHRELAVRHLAVEILELHAGPALAQARRLPPAFDAADSAAKRAAAQREWRQLIRQLFSPQKNAPAALAPNAAALQPALR